MFYLEKHCGTSKNDACKLNLITVFSFSLQSHTENIWMFLHILQSSGFLCSFFLQEAFTHAVVLFDCYCVTSCGSVSFVISSNNILRRCCSRLTSTLQKTATSARKMFFTLTVSYLISLLHPPNLTFILIEDRFSPLSSGDHLYLGCGATATTNN